jgi:hypothetical protein
LKWQKVTIDQAAAPPAFKAGTAALIPAITPYTIMGRVPARVAALDTEINHDPARFDQ